MHQRAYCCDDAYVHRGDGKMVGDGIVFDRLDFGVAVELKYLVP
jgi:hypothetical protein